MNNITIRTYEAGEASYIAYLHMKYYERVYNFKAIFEYYLLSAIVGFIGSPEGGQIWVALHNDKIIGSVAIVHTNKNTAQLRWFLVDTEYQNMGIGKRLMETAMQFCRVQGYTKIFLWTIRTLDAAKHLYESYGFTLTETKINTEWTDEPLTEEWWELNLLYK